MMTALSVWEYQLCYISDKEAWFSSVPPSEVWGDDWNDAPYEHNAGTPYRNSKGEKIELIRVAYEDILYTPAQLALVTGSNCSSYSVEQINRKDTPWLSTDQYENTQVHIWAGETLFEFCRKMKAAKAEVFLPISLLSEWLHPLKETLNK